MLPCRRVKLAGVFPVGKKVSVWGSLEVLVKPAEKTGVFNLSGCEKKLFFNELIL